MRTTREYGFGMELELRRSWRKRYMGKSVNSMTVSQTPTGVSWLVRGSTIRTEIISLDTLSGGLPTQRDGRVRSLRQSKTCLTPYSGRRSSLCDVTQPAGEHRSGSECRPGQIENSLLLLSMNRFSRWYHFCEFPIAKSVLGSQRVEFRLPGQSAGTISAAKSDREYRPDTLILETRYQTARGDRNSHRLHE